MYPCRLHTWKGGALFSYATAWKCLFLFCFAFLFLNQQKVALKFKWKLVDYKIDKRAWKIVQYLLWQVLFIFRLSTRFFRCFCLLEANFWKTAVIVFFQLHKSLCFRQAYAKHMTLPRKRNCPSSVLRANTALQDCRFLGRKSRNSTKHSFLSYLKQCIAALFAVWVYKYILIVSCYALFFCICLATVFSRQRASPEMKGFSPEQSGVSYKHI